MHRAGVLTASLLALAACVLPEPITQEPPPTNPDQGLEILATNPLQRVAPAYVTGGQCTVSLGVTVANPSGNPLTARFFLNDGNPDVLTETNQPLGFEGGGAGTGVTTDFQLSVASESGQQPEFQLASQAINLGDYLAFLVPPSESSSAAVNFIEIVVSDGFAAPTPNDLNFWREAAPQKSVTSAFWNIDLSSCAGLLP
ncbi:MAG TPA: hypothetical protein VMB50_11215 [Myxococcales bacterium]|nr:hypothetical protein [Myxococcales bacterium]